MTAAEQPKYEPSRPIMRFCCGERMTLIKVSANRAAITTAE